MPPSDSWQQRIWKIAKGGARARRAPLHPRRAPYGRHWKGFSEEVFVVGGRLRAPSGQKSPWRDFPEGLSAPSNYIFPVKHSRLEGAEQSQRAPSAPKGEGAWPTAPPLPTPLTRGLTLHLCNGSAWKKI